MNYKIEYKHDLIEDREMNFVVVQNRHFKTDLGGYVDMIRNVRFFNAYSQSDQKLVLKPKQFNRDTQIFDLGTKSVTPVCEFGSQTSAPNLYIDTRTSRIIKPLKYFDSDLWLKRRTEATLFIQKIIRGYLARKRMSNIKKITSNINDEKNFLIGSFQEKIEAAKLLEIEKRAHPRV